MNYLQVRDAVQGLPLYGDAATVSAAIAAVKGVLGGITITPTISMEGWVSYEISNETYARNFEIDVVKRLAGDSRLKGEFYTVRVNLGKTLKKLYEKYPCREVK